MYPASALVAFAPLPVSRAYLSKGSVWLCGACTKPRGITAEQLREGVTIVGAAKVVEEIVEGARTVAFA